MKKIPDKRYRLAYLPEFMVSGLDTPGISDRYHVPPSYYEKTLENILFGRNGDEIGKKFRLVVCDVAEKEWIAYQGQPFRVFHQQDGAIKHFSKEQGYSLSDILNFLSNHKIKLGKSVIVIPTTFKGDDPNKRPYSLSRVYVTVDTPYLQNPT